MVNDAEDSAAKPNDADGGLMAALEPRGGGETANLHKNGNLFGRE